MGTQITDKKCRGRRQRKRRGRELVGGVRAGQVRHCCYCFTHGTIKISVASIDDFIAY